MCFFFKSMHNWHSLLTQSKFHLCEYKLLYYLDTTIPKFLYIAFNGSRSIFVKNGLSTLCSSVSSNMMSSFLLKMFGYWPLSTSDSIFLYLSSAFVQLLGDIVRVWLGERPSC